ncbi:uncharacterized protein BDR25DRAFT_355850 [Lindgomyces ingoldianus]|uniref:Uncharacterized protein n=1 Tax=Lindgomyces ingoldianus TaxID=673940 RepID=A0ACB6QUF6_9PLEO|nr:uncharacterized protein BDR25DRAFT_355850 [Lindgomyces ingoldianus]KAF2470140.1 hypothetical protein BDR25DRAFT_355850 [Lindgomyces ingoldianus]
MTYNNFSPNGGIGLPGAGFASRGKGASLKRLSVASPPKVSSIAENSVEIPTPRTSRSHLLAGLRTAPKTPTSAQPPASAPYTQGQHGFGMDPGRYARQSYNGMNHGIPQTAIGSGFSGNNRAPYAQQPQALYDQVLAPPPVQFDDADIDPNVAAQLLAAELYLAQRQQHLQQQLLNLTAQQFGGMNLNASGVQQQSQPFPSTPYTPQLNAYGQQYQNTSMPQETGQPGVYLAYNQLTGQYNYVLDQNFQQNQQQNGGDIRTQMATSNLSHSPPPPTPSFTSSPPKVDTPIFQVSPPNEINPSPWSSRSSSPPKKSASPPQDVVPLPPPSANAFRRGHKKTLSSLAVDGKMSETPEGPKSAFVRPVGFPSTPSSGTFGPGQARAGEHPMRQPRGPPALEELQASPTTKHEGSKNFATRQRRRAVHNLVRAGIERRGVRSGSAGSMTPVSETEMSFPTGSDNDSDSVHSAGSGSLSGKPSIGSLRAAANGAIGSERKEMKERSRDRTSTNGSYTANSVSSEEGSGAPADVRRTPKYANARAHQCRKAKELDILENIDEAIEETGSSIVYIAWRCSSRRDVYGYSRLDIFLACFWSYRRAKLVGCIWVGLAVVIFFTITSLLRPPSPFCDMSCWFLVHMGRIPGRVGEAPLLAVLCSLHPFLPLHADAVSGFSPFLLIIIVRSKNGNTTTHEQNHILQAIGAFWKAGLQDQRTSRACGWWFLAFPWLYFGMGGYEAEKWWTID